MSINYPGGVDSFPVPTLPETTSLSSAGSGTRDHPEHHQDLGLAIVALEQNAAFKDHDHSGDGTTAHGNKLAQANTHQSADTDTGPTAIHHTLGTGVNQAAHGNHGHSYYGAEISNQPYFVCTSSTRPVAPTLGMTILETDTAYQRCWLQLAGEGAPSWHLLPARTPVCRLTQGGNQTITTSGVPLEWHTELEDSNNFFDGSVSLTDITIRDAGIYHFDAAVQWNPNVVPDVGNVWITVNGVDTHIRKQQFMRGNIFVPGFSQTLDLSGKYRFAANDVVRIKAGYVNPAGGLLGAILSYFDGPTKVTSRFEIAYLGP